MSVQVLLLILLIMFCFPFLVYMSVKLGTYAFFRARYLFETTHQGERDGKPS